MITCHHPNLFFITSSHLSISVVLPVKIYLRNTKLYAKFCLNFSGGGETL